ncbi:MAG: hypothetical protein GXX85_02135 [Ignavibacteria bacterium]|nr:hypothetical protein [Ignavibacteria bacterium]
MDRLVYKTENRIGHIEGRDLSAYKLLHNVRNEEEPLFPTGYGLKNKQKNEQPEAEEPLLPTGFGKPKNK